MACDCRDCEVPPQPSRAIRLLVIVVAVLLL